MCRNRKGSGRNSCGGRVRRTTSRRSGRSRMRSTRLRSTTRSTFSGVPPNCARRPSAVSRRSSWNSPTSAAICDHTPNVRVVPGLDADALRRQAEEIAEANEALAPFRVLRGVEVDILRDGSLDLPDDILAELDWVQLSLHAGQREPRAALTAKVADAMLHPAVRCLSHPTGRILNHRAPNALDLETVFEIAVEHGIAVEVNGLPDRLDLSGSNTRLAVEAGVAVVVSTDAHSIRGLDNMELAVATARRGWATAEDVLNTRPLDAVLSHRAR